MYVGWGSESTRTGTNKRTQYYVSASRSRNTIQQRGLSLVHKQVANNHNCNNNVEQFLHKWVKLRSARRLWNWMVNTSPVLRTRSTLCEDYDDLLNLCCRLQMNAAAVKRKTEENKVKARCTFSFPLTQRRFSFVKYFVTVYVFKMLVGLLSNFQNLGKYLITNSKLTANFKLGTVPEQSVI